MNFKEIHIGNLLKGVASEKQIEISRVSSFFKISLEKVEEMYETKSLDTEILLRWCKLLEYDFFRIYTQHLILYSPPTKTETNSKTRRVVPQFRKNIYTKEVIEYIVELVTTGEKTKQQVISEYNIPKTTLYKWIKKHAL